MPAKSSWLLRIPEILNQLKSLDTPVVDRASCERLFRVKRRQAIYLIRMFSGWRSGNTVLVDRDELIAKLGEIITTPQYLGEAKRKQQLADKLAALQASNAGSRIRLPVSSVANDRMLDSLPSGITLAPGRLTVEFTGAEELFAKLYELGQAATNDFERICQAVSQS